MYYIFKIPGTWTLYDVQTGTSKKLEPPQVSLLEELFSKLLSDGSVLDTLSVAPISASKLQQRKISAPAGKEAGKTQSSPNPVTPNK